MPAWERRFRAPVSFLPEWSPDAPDRIVYASNEPGIWQVHAWDRATGARRRVTDNPVGSIDGMPTLDGEGILWFEDETGDESGGWRVQPFLGGESRPFLEGVPHGWSEGLAQAPGIVAAGISDRDGFALDAQQGVALIVLAGEQGAQLALVHLVLDGRGLGAELRDQAVVVELSELERIGDTAFQAAPTFDLIAQAGNAFHQLLRGLWVVPKIRRRGLLL